MATLDSLIKLLTRSGWRSYMFEPLVLEGLELLEDCCSVSSLWVEDLPAAGTSRNLTMLERKAERRRKRWNLTCEGLEEKENWGKMKTLNEENLEWQSSKPRKEMELFILRISVAVIPSVNSIRCTTWITTGERYAATKKDIDATSRFVRTSPSVIRIRQLVRTKCPKEK